MDLYPTGPCSSFSRLWEQGLSTSCCATTSTAVGRGRRSAWTPGADTRRLVRAAYPFAGRPGRGGERAARDAGLTVKQTVAWNELNPVSRQVDRGTEPGDSFTTYHRPQDPENPYVFYDEQAVTRYDGFCIYRLHLPAGQTLKGD